LRGNTRPVGPSLLAAAQQQLGQLFSDPEIRIRQPDLVTNAQEQPAIIRSLPDTEWNHRPETQPEKLSGRVLYSRFGTGQLYPPENPIQTPCGELGPIRYPTFDSEVVPSFTTR